MSEQKLLKNEKLYSELKSSLESGLLADVQTILNRLQPADCAHILDATPPKYRGLLWDLLAEDSQGEVIQHLTDDVRDGIMETMEPAEVAAATQNLDTDDLADILGALPEQVYQEVILLMDEQDRHRLEKVMSFPEDTAGGLMNTDTITVRPDVTIDVVSRYLRVRGNIPDTTDNLYVVDRFDCLLGTLPITALLTAEPQKTVMQVMHRDIDHVEATTSAHEVAQLFERHDLVSAPVVDGNKKLLGRITIDDVVDVIRDEAAHSILGMAGLNEDVDTFAPVWYTTKRRAIWLGINLITVLIAASVIGLFQTTIDKVIALAILQPIVPSMAGIAGSQTLTLVIRGLAVGHILDSNARWLMWKEVAAGALNGILWALVVAVIASLWFSDPMIGVVIAAAMLITLTVGALSGSVLPLILKKIGIDPVLAGSVILTTITDVVGFFSFLGLAALFYA